MLCSQRPRHRAILREGLPPQRLPESCRDLVRGGQHGVLNSVVKGALSDSPPPSLRNPPRRQSPTWCKTKQKSCHRNKKAGRLPAGLAVPRPEQTPCETSLWPWGELGQWKAALPSLPRDCTLGQAGSRASVPACRGHPSAHSLLGCHKPYNGCLSLKGNGINAL